MTASSMPPPVQQQPPAARAGFAGSQRHKAPHPGSALPAAPARRDAAPDPIPGLAWRLQLIGWAIVAAMWVALVAAIGGAFLYYAKETAAVVLAYEAVFAVWYALRARALSEAPCKSVPENYDADKVVAAYLNQSIFFRFNERYATPWFMDTPLHLVARGNLADLLAYGFWYKTV
jgi:hypothetical protein